MNTAERNILLQQIVWDYNFSPEEIENVLKGKKERAGHYTKELLFQKIIESYPWFTVLRLFSVNEIRLLLTSDLIAKLRSPALREKYEFVRKRLQKVIPAAG